MKVRQTRVWASGRSGVSNACQTGASSQTKAHTLQMLDWSQPSRSFLRSFPMQPFLTDDESRLEVAEQEGGGN